MQGGLGMRYMRLAPNAMQRGFSGQADWDVLKFYGSLNQGQRQNLKQTGQLAFGSLTPESTAILAGIMYGADINLVSSREADRNSGGLVDNMRNAMRNFGGGNQGNDNFLDEPTFVMPTGLPRNGYVSLKMNDETTLMPATSESTPDTSFGAVGLEEAAFMKFMQQDQNMSRFASGLPTYSLVYQGKRSMYDIRFHVSQNVLAKFTLQDNAMDKGQRPTAFTSLPQPIQDKVAKTIEEFKSEGMPFRMAGGGAMARP
jgi:hypothetical protein